MKKRCKKWIKEAGHCVMPGSGFEGIVGCDGYDKECACYEEEQMIDHSEAIESYINGNIGTFKKYIHGLSKGELLRCTKMFIEDYNYTIQKMIWLMEG